MEREPLTVGSLFTGIGGIDLGLERTGGFSTVWQCEIDPYCSAVLEKHWPGLTRYGDIRTIDGTAERVDLIAGGFPCQPVSLAGKGLAQEDPRWLWPEFARVVGLLRPRFVLVENVPGLTNRGLGIVLGDLSEMGYDAEWQVVSAASVGAPHLRERLFVVAYPEGSGGGVEGGEPLRQGWRASEDRGEGVLEGRGTSDVGVAAGSGSDAPLAHPYSELPYGNRLGWSAGRNEPSDSSWWATEPNVGRMVAGVPSRTHRLKSLGNSVVPQVAEFVGNLILESL